MKYQVDVSANAKSDLRRYFGELIKSSETCKRSIDPHENAEVAPKSLT